jgi:hypothetical protein
MKSKTERAPKKHHSAGLVQHEKHDSPESSDADSEDSDQELHYLDDPRAKAALAEALQRIFTTVDSGNAGFITRKQVLQHEGLFCVKST